MSVLIQQAIRVAWDMWDHRNEWRHSGKSARAIAESQRRQVEIREVFADGVQSLLPSDYHWLQDLDRVLQLPPDDQQRWLESLGLAKLRARRRIQRQHSQLEQQRAFMRQWLRPSTSS